MVDTTSVNDITSVGQPSGVEKTLPSYIGPYVNTMLGKGAALANQPYQGYKGQISAGYSDLQNQAFQGLANLTVPTGQMGAYQPRSFTGQTPQMPGAYQPQNQGMMPQPMLGAYQPQNQGMGANIAGSNPMMGASMMPQSLSMSENISDDPMQGIANSAFGRTINNNLPRRQMPAGFEWLDNGVDDVGFSPAEQDAIIAANPNGLADPRLSSTNPSPVTNNPQVYDNGGAGFASGGTQSPQMSGGNMAAPQRADESMMPRPPIMQPQILQSPQGPQPMVSPQMRSTPEQQRFANMSRKEQIADQVRRGITGAAEAAANPQPRVQAPQSQGQGIAQQYMNPYLQSALEPQIAEARRQAAVTRNENAGRLTRAGAFGGGRQAIMESEGQRNMLRNVADVTAKGYNSAYDQARRLFESEEARFRTGQEDTNKFGRDTLNAQMVGGNRQRAIEKEGITADMNQFNLERDYPYQQAKYMQGLLQGLPLGAQNTTYNQPSDFGQASINSSNILAQLKAIIGS